MKFRLRQVWLGMILVSTLTACSSAPPGEFSGAVTTNVGDGRAAARPVPLHPFADPFDMHAPSGALGGDHPDGAQ
jgi:hypothetical protein